MNATENFSFFSEIFVSALLQTTATSSADILRGDSRVIGAYTECQLGRGRSMIE